MDKKAFTLLEMIVTIVILAILSTGIFVSLKHLYIRSAKTKAMSNLSLDSQVISEQISALLYDRVPLSVIGYDGTTGFESVYDLSITYPVLEWIGLARESFKKRDFSGFVDMDGSSEIQKRISTPKALNQQHILDTLSAKFGGEHTIATSDSIRLVFSGSFDDALVFSSADFNNSFGWHGNLRSKIYDFTILNDGNITLAIKPNEIYEKYYLADSAYAIARGVDVDISTCKDINDSNISTDNNTLFLFYNYRPWKGETFCGDKGIKGAKYGNATILSQNASGFEAGVINGTLYFSLTLSKEIKGSENNVTISKQKVVF
ncbi:MAG: type II secretion system protein [Sulfurospirillaceae bacterium]|nr:type II secretion system protein [Sulfurospirillaceae bacterium]